MQNDTKLTKKNLFSKPKAKRPMSAKCPEAPKGNPEPLCPSLLSSAHGIHRKGFKINLANALFSKPEVESNHIPSETWGSRKTSRQPSRATSANPAQRKNKALVKIQKYLRGYLVRMQVQIRKDRELVQILATEKDSHEEVE